MLAFLGAVVLFLACLFATLVGLFYAFYVSVASNSKGDRFAVVFIWAIAMFLWWLLIVSVDIDIKL